MSGRGRGQGHGGVPPHPPPPPPPTIEHVAEPKVLYASGQL